MARMKVFGGLVHMGIRGQCRTIVAATSQAKAAAAVGETLSGFRGWWCETGNASELEVALANPGRVYQATSSMGKDFREMALVDGVLKDA